MRIDRERGEIHFKLTYFGPGLVGKKTCLQYIWNRTRPEYKTALQDLVPADELGVFSWEEYQERRPTLRGRQVWFELTPATLAPLAGLRVKLDLHTNPGACWIEPTRRFSLVGADGVMFVAHADPIGANSNLEALQMLEELLAEGVAYQREIPRVFCYNRRDTDGLCDLADLERDLNLGRRWSSFTISAVRGEGVFDALKALVGAVIRPLEAAPGRLAAR